MNFHEIQEKLTARTPQTFLKLAAEKSQQEEDPFFIFQAESQKTFETNVQFLASEETVTMKDLDYWHEHQFLIVCQTIDGDYIGGDLDETFVIPQSLYKKDVEIFPFFLSDFFTAYEEGKIDSKILPAVSTENEQ